MNYMEKLAKWAYESCEHNIRFNYIMDEEGFYCEMSTENDISNKRNVITQSGPCKTIEEASKIIFMQLKIKENIE